MELSEEERKRLEKLEHELASTDPDLNRLLQAGAPGESRREAATTARGIFTLLGAFTLVLAGITTTTSSSAPSASCS